MTIGYPGNVGGWGGAPSGQCYSNQELYELYTQAANQLVNNMSASRQVEPQLIRMIVDGLNQHQDQNLNYFVANYARQGTFNYQQLVDFLYSLIKQTLDQLRQQQPAQSYQSAVFRSGPAFGGGGPVTGYQRPATTAYGGPSIINNLGGMQGDQFDVYRQNRGPATNLQPAPEAFRTGSAAPQCRTPAATTVPTVQPPTAQPCVEDEEEDMPEPMLPDVTLTAGDNDTDLMELLTLEDTQICHSARTFTDDEGEQYSFLDMELQVPYSSANFGIEDFYNAYPHLRQTDEPHAHFFTVRQMIPIDQPYDQLAPILNDIQQTLIEDIESIGTVLSALPSRLKRDIERELVYNFNRYSDTFLVRSDSHGKRFRVRIENLTDLNALLDPEEPQTVEFRKYSTFLPLVKKAIRQTIDTIFPLTDKATPYLSVDSDIDLNFLMMHESSGLRIQGCVGRELSIGDPRTPECQTMIEQLKRRTVLIRTQSVLCTNIDLPEANYKPNSYPWVITKPTQPLHFILQHLCLKKSQPINIDLTGTSYNENDLWAGLSLSRSLIIIR